jgi:hypothetical protein
MATEDAFGARFIQRHATINTGGHARAYKHALHHAFH